jgi:putative FmdB family regulatory protein
MPIYEYNCSKCGDFETMQRMSDKPLTTCPTCRRKVTKLISSTTFHLKGSGWYITDYARKGEGAGGKVDKKSDDKKSDDKKSESTGTSAASDTSSTDSSSSESTPKISKTSDKGGKKPKAAVA